MTALCASVRSTEVKRHNAVTGIQLVMCYLGMELKLSYRVYLKTLFLFMINMFDLYSFIRDYLINLLECCYIRLVFKIITYMYI